MHLFTDYVQPLTFWLYANPNWALLITFLMAFAESLAIVGSIVPGSVTMTAIGILAGSGVMDLGWTFAIASFGAVAGDSASYALGYIYSDRLTEIWPFKRYPRLINYGKDYFEKHGGKSVLIGRFFGPLRSIIPLIAGILHMNQWHFLLANVISGIGWAALYLVPGVLIGAASTELSAESATRLFVLILLLLAAAWLITQGVKWIILHASHLIDIQIRKVWLRAKHYPRFYHYLKNLAPTYERNHYPTGGLILLFITCLLMSIIITLLVVQGEWITKIDIPCQLFLQSMRTDYFDAFFIIMSLIISPLSLLILGLLTALCALYYRDWRMLFYWISITITCLVFAWILSLLIIIPKPSGLLRNQITPTFPSVNLTLATAMFGFLIAIINMYCQTITMFIVRIVLMCLLFLAGFALIYLGVNWASSILAAYLIGLTLCLAHWIYYRRQQLSRHAPSRPSLPIFLSCSLWLVATGITGSLYFETLLHKHMPYLQQFVLTHEAWWNQEKPLLPVYTINRIGNKVGLFNIQYLGSLNKLQQALDGYGWKRQPDSLFYSLLMRASGKNSAREFPLIAQLYLNKKPNLIMTYPSPKGKTIYILRMWRSNYHLRNYNQPLWLGSVIHLQATTHQSIKPDVFNRILPALSGFKLNNIVLPYNQKITTLPDITPSRLLMIQDEGSINNNIKNNE